MRLLTSLVHKKKQSTILPCVVMNTTVMLWFLFVSHFGISFALEPISITLGAAVTIGSALWDKTHCRIFECCDRHSVSLDGGNTTGLQEALIKSVYGQHLMHDIVLKAIKGHLESQDPAKALALSFHGTPGAGKSYVSNFIVESLYKKGFGSNFVKKFISGNHFPSKQPSKIDVYKILLQKEIKETVQKCERSLFIFEDVSIMAPNILDAVKPFLDYHQSIDNVNYRKSIFIFISNTGAKEINQKTLELWQRGTQREDIALQDFEQDLRQGAFNEQGGWYRSDAISANLIDSYIPFLPLEEKHVVLCIQDEFRKSGIIPAPQDAVKLILDEMTFMPDYEQIYSKNGCKGVAAKVSAFIQGMKFMKHRLQT